MLKCYFQLSHFYFSQGCQPYQFPPCQHHRGDAKSRCSKISYETPECNITCDNSSLVFKRERHQGSTVYQLDSIVQIQTEIMKNGPVTADFTLSRDFLVYKSGRWTFYNLSISVHCFISFTPLSLLVTIYFHYFRNGMNISKLTNLLHFRLWSSHCGLTLTKELVTFQAIFLENGI